MKEERRLVWRVLRHWTEIANGGRFPRRDEIDPWMLGEDGANLVLMAVQSPIELSHFVEVGVNLAVASWRPSQSRFALGRSDGRQGTP